MKGILKAVVLAAGVMGLVACGTIQLNHIVTGTDCATREDCIKDLKLNNPPNPDITFVIEPLLMDEKGKAPIGTPAFNSPVLYGDVDLCIAQAMHNQFKNAKILFNADKSDNSYVDIKPTMARSQATWLPPGGVYFSIDYILNGKMYTAKTDSKVYWSPTTATKDSYPWACRIVAEQIRQTLGDKKINTQ